MNHYYYHSIRLIAGILCLCCFPTIFLHAQISEGGLPPSFQFMTNLKSTEQPVQIPVNFSVEDLKVVDAWRVSQGAPLAIARFEYIQQWKLGDFTRRTKSMATASRSKRSYCIDLVLLRFLHSGRRQIIYL